MKEWRIIFSDISSFHKPTSKEDYLSFQLHYQTMANTNKIPEVNIEAGPLVIPDTFEGYSLNYLK